MLHLESCTNHYYILDTYEDQEQAVYLIINNEPKYYLRPFTDSENLLKYYKTHFYETPSEAEVSKAIIRVNRLMNAPFLYDHYRNFIESIVKNTGAPIYFYDQLRSLIEKEMDLALKAK